MSTRTPEDLHALGGEAEIRIVTLRSDNPRLALPLWIVRVDDALYIGPNSPRPERRP